MLGLEFQLAADILRTAVAPSFTELAQLATVAAIRTALNFFLGLEIKEETELVRADKAAAATSAARPRPPPRRRRRHPAQRQPAPPPRPGTGAQPP